MIIIIKVGVLTGVVEKENELLMMNKQCTYQVKAPR